MAAILNKELRNNYESGCEILDLIKIYINKHPEINLWEALYNLEIITDYENSEEFVEIANESYVKNKVLLDRVQKALKKTY